MKIETAKFKNALNVVKPALASKEIIEQTTSFAFVDGKVVAYNDEICISHPLEDIELDGVIKAEELYKFLGKVKAKEFNVIVDEGEIVMKAGRAKVGFALTKELVLPLDEELSEKEEWQDLPSNFMQACRFATGTASTDMSDPKLTCIHITKDGRIEATDNFRMLIWDLGVEMPIGTTLIPATSIREVVKLDATEVAQGNGWVHFKNGNETTISCRVFEEVFVDTNKINTEIKGEVITFPKELTEVLGKAQIFSQEKKYDGSATLTFKGGRILVQSESDSAWFKENIPFDGDVEFVFSITPYLLQDILKETMKCTISDGMLRFNGNEWVYITSLRDFKK